MRGLTLAAKTLRDSRTTVIAISGVVAAIGLMDVLIYPSYSESFGEMDIPEFFEGFLGETAGLGSPEGFLQAEFFSWIPLLLITIAIIGGTAAIAGEESAGTLDFLLAQPIHRHRLLLEKAAGLGFGILIGSLAGLAGLGAGMLFVDLDVPAGRIAAAIASMLPLTLLFLGLSLWASAALPTRGMAAMLVTGVVIVTYFLNLVGSSVTALDDLRRFSPFYWADFSRVLLYGVDWLRSGAMLALAALFLGLALWSFERRDLSAGGQEWSLPSRLPFRRKARVVVAGNLRRPEAETA